MNSLLSFLEANRTGLFVLFLIVAGVALLIQWFAWIFGFGRFNRADGTARSGSSRTTSLRFLFGDLLVKIIDDFRHLLALILVLIFAVALGIAMYIGHESIDDLSKSMQVVVATLGGLVGSIIGYYFGESTVLKRQPDASTPTVAVSASTEQQPPAETPSAAEDITPAPLPPRADAEDITPAPRPPSTDPPVDDPDADRTDPS